jgi:hypothetical protein
MTHGNRTLSAVLGAGAWVAADRPMCRGWGWLFDVVRFAAARLPAVATVQQVGAGHLRSRGLLSTLMLGVVAVGDRVAYCASRRKEKQALRDSKVEGDLRARHLGPLAGPATRRRRRLVQRAEKLRETQTRDQPAPRGQPTRAASDEWAIRVSAGFNIVILSPIIGVGVRQESRYRR